MSKNIWKKDGRFVAVEYNLKQKKDFDVVDI